jgi:hypothetical protein
MKASSAPMAPFEGSPSPAHRAPPFFGEGGLPQSNAPYWRAALEYGEEYSPALCFASCVFFAAKLIRRSRCY